MADDLRHRLRTLLFVDIETVASVQSFEELPERMQHLWDKKASKIPQHVPEPLSNAELFYDRAAIYAEFGRIVCIAFGAIYWNEANEMALKVRSFSGTDEAALLRDFRDLLGKYAGGNPVLCAHNGKEFDFPYLCRRMIINGIDLPSVLQLTGKKPWEILHQDTMDMWKYGDYKSYTSLDLLAAVFDIPGSKGEMDGSQVTPVFYEEEGGLEKISRYCREDVVVLAQLYLRLQNHPLVLEKNIFRIE
jgi:DNA polymerase elongation subunit (family B)